MLRLEKYLSTLTANYVALCARGRSRPGNRVARLHPRFRNGSSEIQTVDAQRVSPAWNTLCSKGVIGLIGFRRLKRIRDSRRRITSFVGFAIKVLARWGGCPITLDLVTSGRRVADTWLRNEKRDYWKLLPFIERTMHSCAVKSQLVSSKVEALTLELPSI